MNMHPLILEPIFKAKVWGARNLERLFNKSLPPNENIGESWECADLDAGQSTVARGPAQGKTLHALVDEWGVDLLGSAKLTNERFPLLIKFLDAAQDLSVQVHPDAKTAQRLGGNVHVKHEAWYILEAEKGACIYRGLKPGSTVGMLEQEIRNRPAAIMDHLCKIQVLPGEVYYLPSGTLHALGAGVVVAEVQTPSDITYRLYDYDRVRPAGDAGLHVDQGLACIRTDIDIAQFEKRTDLQSSFATTAGLVRCPSFAIDEMRSEGDTQRDIPRGELAVWIILEGQGEIRYGNDGVEHFAKGDVVILPAALDRPVLETHAPCKWLGVTIPR